MTKQPERKAIKVTGLVQGVGFRPFLFNLAQKYQVTGWVRNNFAGVEVEIQGAAAGVAGFIDELQTNPPSAAQLDTVVVTEIPVVAETEFRIMPSQSGELLGSPLPDQGICPVCMAEYVDPADRRYHHPFNSCTICGPRFTIIESLPFDRPRTSMADFALCPDCHHEYTTPVDRRFHAQTIACPQCGPELWFADPRGERASGDPVAAARSVLQSGGILGIKGVGGYHLACDATCNDAVAELRRRKGRDNRAFAVMFKDAGALAVECTVTADELKLLTGPVRPILLVPQRSGSQLAPAVNPGLKEIGAFLPYTGIQLLLFEAGITALVMTSGNRSGEPLSTEDQDAFAQLGPMVDGFLGHNRPILWRCDDSVLRYQSGKTIGIRRSRGLAPAPLKLARSLPPLLACGAQQKNVFALTKDEKVYLSPHQGDLDNVASFLGYQETIARFQRLIHCKPEWVVHDLHPDYQSTLYAKSTGLPAVAVQHHLAHIAATVALEKVTGPVIGVAFDGSGYGPDGAIWGGEFLVGEGCRWRRAGFLQYYPLPGGEAAVREPWRMTAAYLDQTAPEFLAEWLTQNNRYPSWEVLKRAVQRGVNAPLTSSVGRWFDGIATLLGAGTTVSYEGEAAIWLENQADLHYPGVYELPVRSEAGQYRIDPGQLVAELSRDLQNGLAIPAISMKFHRSVATLITELAAILRNDTGIGRVVLCGGVFQNRLLLDLTYTMLAEARFEVLVPQWLPINDGGIALGQAWLGGLMIERGVHDVFSDTW